MEVLYKKDFDKNYMLIKSKADLKEYKIKMVLDNSIVGMNDASIKEFNNETTIYYDISGKISLANEYAGKKMKAEDIRAYIMGVQRLLESSKQYMLDIDKFLMDFEYTYVKHNDSTPYFCYYPDKKESFSESLQKVFDKMIEIADHSDRETVIISYGLQQLKLSENNITIKEIVRFVNEKNYVDEGQEDCGKENNGVVGVTNNYMGYDEGMKEYIYGSATDNEYMAEKMNYDASVEKTKSFPNKVKEMLQPILKMKENILSFKEKYQTEEELDSILAEDEVEYGAYDDATVLLKAESMQKGIILKCSDLDRPQTITPNDYPCILGKSKKSADYVIDDKAISRVHLRLHEEESGYYIEDLNSTNGTYLNEEKLNPHQLMKVNIGDRVKLSEIEYVIC